VLQGGGARTAYQAGVLSGIAEVLQQAGWPAARNPFPVVCGTSAGALNAAFFASGACDWMGAAQALPKLWSALRAEHVFRTEPRHLLRGGLRWLALLSFGWLVHQSPRALLDNAPLEATLQRLLRLDGVEAALGAGALRAFAVTASSYTSGRHLTFFQGSPHLQPWQRERICGVPQTITIAHLLASAALPFVFPAVRLWGGERLEYCGDGAMRQLAPLAPAIRLGARCAIAIGVGEPFGAAAAADPCAYPSIAQISGHVLSTAFFDTLPADVELAEQINAAVRELTPAARATYPLREFPVLLFTPSQSIDALATEHWKNMPRSVRLLLGAIGAGQATGAALASHLLFDPEFSARLIDLGRADARLRAEALLRFLEAATD
jgi:NTE family protein